MAEPPRIVIVGGSGVFGRLLVRETLRHTAASVVIAGRDLGRAEEFARELDADDRVSAQRIDLADLEQLANAARGSFAIACAAGPFQGLDPRLPSIAIEAGAHWLDVSDAAGWVQPLLGDHELSRRAVERDLTILSGQSCVPALSGALARRCRAMLPSAEQVRITLFIGNRNRKGAGAVASALGSGFRDPRWVGLPIGRKMAFRFESPDSVLLSDELRLKAEFRVAFELGIANWLMFALQPLGSRLNVRWRARLAGWLSRTAAPLSGIGSDFGCLQVESRDGSGNRAAVALVGSGQRLAILPIAFALRALLNGELAQRGVVSPATWLLPDEWHGHLLAAEMAWHESVSRESVSHESVSGVMPGIGQA